MIFIVFTRQGKRGESLTRRRRERKIVSCDFFAEPPAVASRFAVRPKSRRVNESTGYMKCACVHCAGRIEFPGEMAGTGIECPHCHAKTTLSAPSVLAVPAIACVPRRIRKRVLLPILFAVVASGVFLLVMRSRQSLAVRELKLDRATTNSAGVVAGVLENKSSRARRNVRVEMNLLNARGETLWQATDHTPEIAPGGTWQFRALVLDTAVVTGKLARVRAD
jgi:hypothetical protein